VTAEAVHGYARHAERAYDATVAAAQSMRAAVQAFCAAPSDATLARAVREVAKDLRDAKGFNGIVSVGAAMALVNLARDRNAAEMDITLDGVRIMVRLLSAVEQDKGTH
jgi:uncharacterized iron-regulated protein